MPGLFVGEILPEDAFGRVADAERINSMDNVAIFQTFKKSRKSHTGTSKSMQQHNMR